MTHWMRRMAIDAVAKSCVVLPKPLSMPLFNNSNSIPFYHTPATPFLVSMLTPSRRSLSAPPSCSPIPTFTSDDYSSDFGDGDCVTISRQASKVLLKGMTYPELQGWVQSHGYRPGQAMMLWKRMYGNSIWAHHSDELEGMNKDFKKMLSENAEFKALSLKEIRTAADGTKKDITDFVHIG